MAAEHQESAWEALVRLTDEAHAAGPRAGAAAAVPRHDRAAAGRAPTLGVRRLVERTLEASGYAAALARDDSQESQDRLENLAELLAAAADYEGREEGASLVGLPGPRGARLGDRSPERRRPRAADDAARGQGPRVRVGVPGRAGGGAAAALAQPHERGGPRGGAPALLRRHDPGDGAAAPVLGAQPPGLRPAAGEPAEPVPGRDPARGAGEKRRPRAGGAAAGPPTARATRGGRRALGPAPPDVAPTAPPGSGAAPGCEGPPSAVRRRERCSGAKARATTSR